MLAAWLLGPYIDLRPCVLGPLYARGIEHYWRAFSDGAPAFYLQRTLPPAFRVRLFTEIRQPERLVSDPRELPESLRSERWSELCDAVEGWRGLSGERKRALVLLMHALCLYEPVLRLVPEKGENDAELAYWRASARYVLGATARLADYRSADMTAFERLAEGDAVPAAFNAAVKLLVHEAKTGAPAGALARLGTRLARVLAETIACVDSFTAGLLTSRYYRAAAFLPQRSGDRKGVARLMTLAERHARRLKPSTPAQEVLYLENLHPVLESRAKEALWLGDHDLALRRVRQVVKVDPYDSKAWVELGQVRLLRKEWPAAAEAYVTAAMLGPPASAIGRHMAGVCLRKCGQEALAAFLFKETLEVDPAGISPHEEIRKLPDIAAFRALKTWSLRAF